jgi:diguanylate cyclase (GGDEF)-like protein
MSDLFTSSKPAAALAGARALTRSTGWLGFILGMVMAAALAVIISVQLYQDRAAARDHAQEAAVNLTGAIARDISRHVDLFRFVLSSLRDTVTSPDFQQVPEHLRDIVLFSHTAAPKALGVLFVTDANGIIEAESGGNDVRGQSRAWRPYFAYHRDHDDPAMLITGPLISATTKDPVIVLSMRLNRPDGSFRGVVVASMLLTYFDGLLTDLQLDEGSALTLFLDQGIILARQPADPLAIGRDLRQDPHLQAIIGEPLAIYEEPGALDDTRLVVSTAVAGSTMRVSLAQSLDLVYGHWWRKAWTIGLTSALLISGIITLISLLHRESRQRSRVQVALAEANARLERMATTDPLTGIANRRMFDDMLQREQTRVTRMPHDAAILMIDIDLFKSFNDTYGHGAGDATLRSVALAITRAVSRGGDLAARIGGEEFAVLLTQTDLTGARTVADRIRETVAALGIRHSGSPHGHVTVSIGLASTGVGPVPASFEVILDSADEALYTAKKNGRDRVEIASPSMVAA